MERLVKAEAARQDGPAERLPAGTLALHVVANALVVSGVSGMALMFMPLLARLRFGASDWQTLLITAAVPTLLIAAVFWTALLSRVSLARYLAIQWVVGMAPLAAIALAQNYWHLLACHLVAALGIAGWMPATGAVLKRLYPDSLRGRAYSVLVIGNLLSVMGTTALAGEWQAANPEAFRLYLPGIVVCQAVGVAVLVALVRSRPGAGPPAAAERWRLRNVLRPLAHLGGVLRSDAVFRRYEIAFMTYGAGFMICDALLPVYVTDALRMNYDQIARAGFVAYGVGMLVCVFPVGFVLDRLGEGRTAAVSFVLLGAYPVLLLAADGMLGLTIARVWYGAALGGVILGWMLGPVTLAPSVERVAEYVAIHTTLVGVRGLIGQAGGVLAYRLGGSFAVPLVAAAALFVMAAVMMWRLHPAIQRRKLRRMAGTRVKAPAAPPTGSVVAGR